MNNLRHLFLTILSVQCLHRAAAAEPKFSVTPDVAFLAADRAEKLDLYLPEPPAAGQLSPALVWIHGGGWTGGTKAEELDRVAKERGASHELIYLEGIGHTFDLQTWSKKPLPRDLRPVVLDFLAKHMRERVRKDP